MASSYGSTPIDVFYDRHLVECWAGPEAQDVLGGHDPIEDAAIHEAGHLCAAWRFGLGIRGAFIRLAGDSGARGLAMFGYIGESTLALEEQRVAFEELRAATPTWVPTARQQPRYVSDVRRAVGYAKMLRADRKVAHELVRVRRFEARLLVNRDAALIRAVAAELLKVGRLSGIEVEAIIATSLDAARARRLKEIGI